MLARRTAGMALAVLMSPLWPSFTLAKGLDGADVWNSTEIAWRDFGTGVREATRTGKPVLMVFQATWCSACRKYRSVFKDPGVVAASRDLVMILVDIDKTPEVNSGFSPDGTYVPRSIFLDPTGEIRADLKGKDPKYPHSIDVADPAELLALMKRASGNGEAAPDPGRRAEAGTQP